MAEVAPVDPDTLVHHFLFVRSSGEIRANAIGPPDAPPWAGDDEFGVITDPAFGAGSDGDPIVPIASARESRDWLPRPAIWTGTEVRAATGPEAAGFRGARRAALRDRQRRELRAAKDRAVGSATRAAVLARPTRQVEYDTAFNQALADLPDESLPVSDDDI